MEIKYGKDGIVLEKTLNELDKFVIKVTALFDSCNIDYAIMAGYVAILFGRTRGTEDVDVFVKLEKSRFDCLAEKLEKEDLWIVNTSDPEQAFTMLSEGDPIRISRKEGYAPNFEIKIAKDEVDRLSLESKIRVSLNGHELYIVPLEMEIAFKLYLGTQKDLEDARHLFKLFEGKLDMDSLKANIRRLRVEEHARKYLSI